MSTFPAFAASMSAVRPSADCASSFAPCASMVCTVERWPPWAAAIRAVQPSTSVVSTAAHPGPSQNFTELSLPALAALTSLCEQHPTHWKNFRL
eukprot:9452492-Pyramimonas_sp.AAC.1